MIRKVNLYGDSNRKMKTKQLLILGGVFVFLLLVVIIFENPFGKSEYEKKVETATPLFPNFDEEQVTKIEIIATDGTATLVKNGLEVALSHVDIIGIRWTDVTA